MERHLGAPYFRIFSCGNTISRLEKRDRRLNSDADEKTFNVQVDWSVRAGFSECFAPQGSAGSVLHAIPLNRRQGSVYRTVWMQYWSDAMCLSHQ